MLAQRPALSKDEAATPLNLCKMHFGLRMPSFTNFMSAHFSIAQAMGSAIFAAFAKSLGISKNWE